MRRRWEGVYAQCIDGAVCLREEIEPGVWLVTGPGRPRHDVLAGHRRRHAGGGGGGAHDRAASRLACLDMAGTTVRDDGAVEAAFTTALAAVGIAPGSRALRARPRSSCARRWAGPRRTCSPRSSSPDEAARATAAFAAAYEAIVAGRDVGEIPGALRVLRDLRAAGVQGLPHHRVRPLAPGTRCSTPWAGGPRSTWPSRRPTSAGAARRPT